jgi:TIR domain
MPPALEIDRARVYLSFADEDRPRAMELARWLNDSGWLVRADLRHAFAPGSDWTDAIAERLDTCDIVLFVITPGWLISKYCRHEYSYAAKQGKFVLPVLCELTDLALLPDGLRARPRVDLMQNRMIDYLALKEVLMQLGSPIGRAAAAEIERKERRGSGGWMMRRMLAWACVAFALSLVLGSWLLWR